MNNIIWHLFVKTGNVETYLLLKQLEDEHNVQEVEVEAEIDYLT